jgi:hypothetical protein
MVTYVTVASSGPYKDQCLFRVYPAMHFCSITRSLLASGATISFSSRNWITYVRFKVVTAANMKFRIVFWNILPCKVIFDRRFRGTCSHHHHGSHPR